MMPGLAMQRAVAPGARPPGTATRATHLRGDQLRPRRRGTTLVEALVALALAAVGLLGLARAQLHLDYAADVARQRGEAVRLAEAELETLRGYSRLDASGPWAGYDAMADADFDAAGPAGANALFHLQRRLTPSTDTRHRVVAIEARWIDRQGQAQRHVLRDLIARAAPELSGRLALQPPVGTRAPLGARHASIPQRAVDLGDGRSAYKPRETGSVAWVFDNRLGEITSSCSVPADRPTARLTATDLATVCTAVRGQLLAGTVRFNLRGSTHRLPDGRSLLKPVHPGTVAWLLAEAPAPGITAQCSVPRDTAAAALTATDLRGCTGLVAGVSPFDAAHAADPLTAVDSESPRWPALALQVRLTLTSSGHPAEPDCLADAPETARAGAAIWQVEYACLVPMNPDGRWQGRSTIEPLPYADAGAAAWPIGTAAGAFRVCRYAPSDATDLADPDHPAVYGHHAATCADDAPGCTGVRGNLGHQNFLVVDGTQACPSDHTADPAAGDLVNSHTVAYQP